MFEFEQISVRKFEVVGEDAFNGGIDVVIGDLKYNRDDYHWWFHPVGMPLTMFGMLSIANKLKELNEIQKQADKADRK